jgi:hypothetical protein
MLPLSRRSGAADEIGRGEGVSPAKAAKRGPRPGRVDDLGTASGGRPVQAGPSLPSM